MRKREYSRRRDQLKSGENSSLNRPKNRKLNRSYDMPPFEQTISRQMIVDKVAELLYQLNIVPDRHLVSNIQFSELFGSGDVELTKMKIFTRKEQEGKVLIHNAT